MKNRLYNVIFPIWLIIFIPPIILGVIPANFLIDAIVLYLILKFMKFTNIKEIFKKNYLKVVGFGFLADIIGGILLLLSLFVDSLNDMGWNPYKSILCTIYLLIVFIISTYLIYLFNNKFNFKNIEDKNKTKKISILIAVLTAPYLFLVPTSLMYNTPESIYDYYNIEITNTSKVEKTKNFLETSELIDKFIIDKDNYKIEITLKDSDDYYNYYKNLEEDASVLFNSLKKLNTVVFKVNSKEYTFEFNHINSIYNNNLKINDYSPIYIRYADNMFEDYIYMGNINGKYDLFDASENCSTNLETIYEDQTSKYSISCNNINKLIVVDKNNYEVKIPLKQALNDKLFNVNALSTTDLKIYKEAK